MKKTIIILIAVMTSMMSFGQQTGYYNGTSAKDGEELKAALNDIIKGHISYSYYTSKHIFKLSDADPDNPDNVILVYTGRSHPNDDYGTGGNYINREHVWAKSHGGFEDWLPMDSDVHNLKPADGSVNVARSNKDFDNGGVQHSEATECYYTDSTWEARDAVKGDIARIIFYMSTRYEGEDGELDLEVVDWNNTFPYPQHGKLSTLLEWNLMDARVYFERNRNDVIFSYQKNRNPFIDNPEFIQLIWGGETASTLSIDNLQISPEVVIAQQEVQITATITNNATATLKWGLSYESLNNEVAMTNSGDVYTANIPGQVEDATVYYQIIAEDGQNESSTVVYNYYVPKIFTGTIVSIYNIQGQQEDSPYEGQVVSTTGVVTANFGNSYFIQDGSGAWNGLFIYESGRNPSVGDSIILTGEISEYTGNTCDNTKTEMLYISDYYFISANNDLPESVVLQVDDISEEHESILISVNNAICTFDEYQTDYFMWRVNDGTGTLKIHNTSIFEYDPTLGVSYNITGPLNWDYCEWKIELRFESDVQVGVDLEAPYVDEVTPIIYYNIKVLFNEPVDETTAEELANYSLSNNGNIISADQHSINKSQVNLTVDPLYGDYDLTVQNVEDVAGNVMETQTISFTYLDVLEQTFDGNISIYPNPANDYLVVAADKPISSVVIYGLNGKKVKEYNGFVENTAQIDISEIVQGTYVIEVYSDENKSLGQKVVVR